MNKRILIKINTVLSIFLWCGVYAQTTFPVNGVPDIRHTSVVFVHANIFTDYQTLIKNGSMHIQNDRVVAVGEKVAIPKNAQVIDLQGKYIYPGFIDLFTSYGIAPNEPGQSKYPQYGTRKQGIYAWNEAIKSYQQADKLFINDPKKAENWLKNGFSAVLTHQADGICRGTGALVALSPQSEHVNVLVSKATSHYSLNKGTSTQAYPTALAGAIALLRQTFYDRNWYENQKVKNETHAALEALVEQKNLPFIMQAGDKQSILRANAIANEFGIRFLQKTEGDEYQMLSTLKNANTKLIVPLHFPKAYHIENAFDADVIPFQKLKHWELAPYNAYFLWKEGINFSLTQSDLENPADFLPNLRKAIQAGLPEKEAIKALTYHPALFLGVHTLVGALQKNRLANFIITSDSIAKNECVVHENWVLGHKIVLNPIQQELRGIYYLRQNGGFMPDSLTVSITGKPLRWEVEIMKDTIKTTGKLTYTAPLLTIDFTWNGQKIYFTCTHHTANDWDGIITTQNNTKITGKLHRILDYVAPLPTDSAKNAALLQKNKNDSLFKNIGKVLYPFQAYGNADLPTQKRVLFKNATVWTNEVAGILEATDVLIDKGKIVQIGKINAKADTAIDATGKHLTSGIIDEHSHIAISGGVNECSHSITAEVRMGDVIDYEDINIYRNLAGGVTAAQILHGSCNCIGGQSGIVKLRWGKTGPEMQIKNTDGFIKFALGENVKQSNWGDNFRERFPQTRMGVEQVIEDAFQRAKEYENIKKSQTLYRKDLQLEAIAEILNKKRFISCHSYVNSEILMLMQLTERFGIRVNTFTHILEGYKLADEMRKHGAGGSTFSDWWAYKFEVKDATPYNAALMHKKGVTVAINSDNAEMARRLNQEAAKAIKYGGVSEPDAWKMVTLHPAKLLHLDKFTGSISVGKEADLVLWSHHPLSVYAICEATFVDGICYYDIQTDSLKKKNIHLERTRILEKMAHAIKNGAPFTKPVFNHEEFWHCGTGGEDKE